jgi:hypothetical protein
MNWASIRNHNSSGFLNVSPTSPRQNIAFSHLILSQIDLKMLPAKGSNWRSFALQIIYQQTIEFTL